MKYWFFNDIISFFVSILFAAIIIPQILRVALKKNIFDEIDDRKIHHGRVPRLGGLAFFPSILFSFAIVIGFSLKYLGWDPIYESFPVDISFIFLMCAVAVMYMVGIVDDLKAVRYLIKFITQIIAGILIIFSGVYITNFYGFLWITRIYDWIGWIVTVVMVVYIINSINLIDGIDGLASGISGLAFIFYAIILYAAGLVFYSVLACASAGTLIAFFYYNVFGNVKSNKKIFMGDTGSLTIGVILAFCAISMLHLGESQVALKFNPVILGLSPLMVPLLDSVRVFFNRILRHKNPFMPDKTHIHHKFLSLGLSQAGTLIVIMIWAMFFILINMFLSLYINPTLIILADVAVWCVVNIIISKKIAKKDLHNAVKPLI